ncbi:hypothetical protein FSW04_13570 [Baekduia soli]|uniref:Uncharacterized protein n=1 Tax=Baekduia soli TaxID=496014 RepID=A0A5B8U5Y0_9ACTN|nr:hypothetical protein [Baekduia soli]QEC48493.1 hypothetical protein FSW04_13570 [Baekduia soli]
MGEERSHGRGELMVPYERPYRYVLARTWRGRPQLRRLTALTVVLLAGGGAGVAAGQPLLGLVLGLGAMFAAAVAAAWLVAVAQGGRAMTRSWRHPHELASVRAHRPQAGTEDCDVAHVEYAVSVQDDGHLVTWCFRPLEVSEGPRVHEVEIPGRPRYAATPVEETPFAARDTVRAAEQLVEAQARAADLEAAAAREAHAAIDAARADAELAAEARSTAAALQRSTGQRSRRG